MAKLTHNTKTSLHEESKAYRPNVLAVNSNLEYHPDLLDRIAKYCVVYAESNDICDIEVAMNRWEQVFDTKLPQCIKRYQIAPLRIAYNTPLIHLEQDSNPP